MPIENVHLKFTVADLQNQVVNLRSTPKKDNPLDFNVTRTTWSSNIQPYLVSLFGTGGGGGGGTPKTNGMIKGI